jgi:hypothetical protein
MVKSGDEMLGSELGCGGAENETIDCGAPLTFVEIAISRKFLRSLTCRRVLIWAAVMIAKAERWTKRKKGES